MAELNEQHKSAINGLYALTKALKISSRSCLAHIEVKGDTEGYKSEPCKRMDGLVPTYNEAKEALWDGDTPRSGSMDYMRSTYSEREIMGIAQNMEDYDGSYDVIRLLVEAGS